MSRDPLDYSKFSKDSSEKDFDQFGEETNTRSEVRGKIVDVTSKIKEKAGNVAATVSDTVDKTREQAVEGLGQAASKLHEKAADIPGGPRITSAAHTVANGMESVANYLREANFGDMKESALKTCRQYPAQTVIGALAVGFLVGRAIRRR